METLGPWIAFGALAIAAGSLAVNAIGLRKKTEQSYTDELEGRVGQLEARMKECEDARERLLEENTRTGRINIELATENARLMRDLLAIKGPHL